jgi:pimeloyl-ACP methyl ester carboxylesterase
MYATWFINEYADYGGRLQGAILSEPGAFTKGQLDDYTDTVMGGVSLTSEMIADGMWSRQFLSAADHERMDYLAVLMTFGGLPSEHLDPNKPMPMWRSGSVVNNQLKALVDDDGFDWTTNLAAYPKKVLFLRGELNENMPLSHQQELASSYPNAEIVTIPGVGHEMIWEKPDEYLAHARTYFQQIGFTGVTP